MAMTQFIVLILVSLWVGEGRAEEWTIRNMPPSSIRIDRESFDAMIKDYPDAKLRVMLVDEPCERKMQAAMEAMEPFALVDPQSNIMIVDQHGNYVLSPNSYWSGISITAVSQRVAALEHWQSVKKECWRQP